MMGLLVVVAVVAVTLWPLWADSVRAFSFRAWLIKRAHHKAVLNRALEILGESPDLRFRHEQFSRCASLYPWEKPCAWCAAEKQLTEERAAINKVIRESLT